jgi:hypothetical protein
MSLRGAFLATLKGLSWKAQDSEGRDCKLTGEEVIAVHDAIAAASREGRDPKPDLLALFPGAKGLSDRRIDRSLQLLRRKTLIVHHKGRWTIGGEF